MTILGDVAALDPAKLRKDKEKAKNKAARAFYERFIDALRLLEDIDNSMLKEKPAKYGVAITTNELPELDGDQLKLYFDDRGTTLIYSERISGNQGT